jgi:hypothetical protein
MPVIKGIRYGFNEVPESVLESLSMDELREVARQDMAEQQNAQIEDHQKAEAITSAAEQANLEEYKSFVERKPEPAEEPEWLTKEEILERQNKAQAKYVEDSKPEAQLEAAARQEEESLAKRVENLQYVRDSLQKGIEPIRSVVAEEVARQQAELNESLALQRSFVAGHKDYVTSEHNGSLMVKFHQDNGYTRFSSSSLELAYSVLKSQGKLQLVAPEELQRRQQIQQQVDAPRRKSSSISSRDSISEAGFYTPRPQREIDPETIPLDELRKIIEQNADPAEVAEERRRFGVGGVGRF